MSLYRLDKLFAPRSIALVGASPRKGSLGRAVLSNLRKTFKGPLHLVNPRHAAIDGMATVRDLGALAEAPDLIVVTAPAREVPSIIGQAAAKGVAGAVIISGGLGHGPGSLAAQAESTARSHGMRLIGPNCLGMINPGLPFNASFSATMPPPGDLALISQSGAIVAAVVGWASTREIGFSGIASIGDQLDVDVADLLDYFALDPATRVILLYLEGVKNARKFMSSARAAARLKPVIVVKSGRFAAGAKAAATHTGALAGSDEVHEAAFRRAGLIRVIDLPELFDCAEAVGHIASARGRRLAILTNGGGLGVLAIDRLVSLGGTPALLSPEGIARLDAVLPLAWSRANPVDIIGDADGDRYSRSLEILLDDPQVDAVLAINVATAVALPADTATAVANTARGRKLSDTPKPVLAAWVGTDGDGGISAIFNKAGVPNYPTEDDAVRGFMHLVGHQEAFASLFEVPPSLPVDFRPDIARARHIAATAASEGRKLLDPIEVAELLKAFDVPLVETLLATDPDQVAEIAGRLLKSNKAVVVKIMSRDISHKSDVGGVRLGISDAEEARRAATEIIGNARRLRPDAKIAGLIVQPMKQVPDARELIAGIADDPTFGPIMLFGAGGTAVEVINDKTLALPPLDMNLAARMIQQTRVAKLLNAYRNVPAVKFSDVALTLVKLSYLAAWVPEVIELDINPLLANEQGVIALDARIAVAPASSSRSGNPRIAVRPYPVEWQRDIGLNDLSVILRPVRPEDAPLFEPFLAKTTQADLRMRFFAPIKRLGAPFVARLTQLDYARAMAFCAIDKSTGEMIGVVRMHADSQYESAEYGVLVRSDLKGRGLGWLLMQHVIDYAKSEGLQRMEGQVLGENTTMLKMCREFGFRITPDTKDKGIMKVSLSLT